MPNLFAQDTLRLSILQYVVELYRSATAADPAPAGRRTYGVDFSVVELGPLGDPDARKHTAVGVVGGTERKSEEFPVKNNELDIDVQFRITVNKADDSPLVMGERLLGVIQQVMLDDETLGGLVFLMHETGAEIDVTTYADRTVYGVAKFRITYRQTFNDVYTSQPTV